MPAEISVRGSGPVACVLALLLQQAGRPVVLNHRRSEARAPLRPIALSHASRLILERVGVWQTLAPTPIETIHVSQQGGFGRTQLCAADAGVPALGYVLDYGVLLESLFNQVSARAIRVEPETGESLLVVHAEGFASHSKEKNHPQEALVALVTTRPAAAGTAWERFTPQGPLALLPLGGRYCALWSLPPERARALCAAPAADFLQALTDAFGRRAGEFVAVGERVLAPLALRVRPSRVSERQAYIGNAAQTLHPVAGQGLNLGLRDAWDLAQVLRYAPDPGDARVLQRFAAMRRLDAMASVRVTSFLAWAFLGANPLTGLMRGFALTALDICLPARRFFARRMIYGTSALP
ncbi:MAG: 2-octaprenyl-6-methoxyphenyl hydroxylase [Betaproteobacteria bacterium]|nr:2-octaprenyl-6-methoxyphenyl hydroxylase [Betaproteobacteria bacterium]